MIKLTLCLLLSTCFVFSAHSNNRKPPKSNKKQLIEIADSVFFAENFDQSFGLYEKILKNYPSDHYVQYHRYVAYHLSKGRGTDVDQIYDYEQKEGKVDKFYNYWLGRIHYERYEFDIAKKHFQAFLDLDVFRSAEIRKETIEFLEKTEKAQKFHNNPDDYQIVPLPSSINSEYADISPAFFGDHKELLFASARPDGEDESITVEGDFRIFHALKENEKWTDPSVIHRLGIFSQENAKIEVVNQDGKLFMFLNENNGGLFYSEPTSNGWTLPKEFDTKIDGKTIDAHFFINDSEDKIFFSAANENGGLDILESHFIDVEKVWSSPKPLMGEINSEYNEDSPFLSHDGKYLYFSSDRKESVGGYDVFRSQYNEITYSWSKPENLGFPINTIDDEINFQLNEDNISGFMSSNRLHSKGDYDIYYFHKTKKVIANGTITDNETGEPVPNIQVQFLPIEYTDESFQVYTDSKGNYSMEVFEDEQFVVQTLLNDQVLFVTNVTSSSKELNRSFQNNFTVDLPFITLVHTNYIELYEGLEGDSEYSTIKMLGNKFGLSQKAILRNAYFDFHSYQLKEEASETINQIFTLLQKSQDVKIEISGHTDNVGTFESNQYISLKRAQSIKNELVKMGISDDRLVTLGYGDTQPLASNDDEENGRELNRRIEVRLLN